jgi:hypothetical protein
MDVAADKGLSLGGHVWTTPALQEESGVRPLALMCSAERILINFSGSMAQRCKRYASWASPSTPAGRTPPAASSGMERDRRGGMIPAQALAVQSCH